jgi:Thrombospondin type 3 repeat
VQTPDAGGDRDGDGINDEIDNCPGVDSVDQLDTDADGIGDVCDPDLDGDGVDDRSDNCQSVANSDQTDFDKDTVGDACDADRDGDAILNAADNCPDLANPNQQDLDNDKKGKGCDTTDDVKGSGVRNNWSESVGFGFDALVLANGSGLLAEWSVRASNNGWFYPRDTMDPPETEIAVVNSAAIRSVVKASSLAYVPVAQQIEVNQIVVMHNRRTGTYAAIRFDRMGNLTADVEWFFNGYSDDFSSF